MMAGHRVTEFGQVGRQVPSVASILRPDPLHELHEWGGEHLVRRKRVLDLGCGDGRFALGIAPLASTVEGLDPDADAIRTARRSARRSGLGNVRFGVGAAQQLPYRDGAFDVVLLSWTL
jgi:ubiquinone/menaquinone biosynthesis C-methylase UbiE